MWILFLSEIFILQNVFNVNLKILVIFLFKIFCIVITYHIFDEDTFLKQNCTFIIIYYILSILFRLITCVNHEFDKTHKYYGLSIYVSQNFGPNHFWLAMDLSWLIDINEIPPMYPSFQTSHLQWEIVIYLGTILCKKSEEIMYKTLEMNWPYS